MSRSAYLFTSESVSEGHPDKVCDRISDTIVDAYLGAMPEARVACETLATTNRVVIAGEVRGPDSVLGGIDELVRKVIRSLPPAQQRAIDLAFFRGMSQREIAAHTNTPLGTVKTRLELGLKKIYDGLKELKDEL